MALDLALKQGKILLSFSVLAKLYDVLGRKQFRHYIREEEIRRFLAFLTREAEWVDINAQIAACRYPKDDEFLEPAVSGQAGDTVTGDADLIALHPFRTIQILTPGAFLEVLNSYCFRPRAIPGREVNPLATESPICLFFFRGEPRFGPGAPAAVHRNAIFVAHFLQVIRGEGGAEAAAAIKNQRRGPVRDRRFDVTLNDSLAEVNGPGQVAPRPFIVFADVHQCEFLAGVEPLFHFAETQLLYASFRVIDDSQKSRRMIHEIPPRLLPERQSPDWRGQNRQSGDWCSRGFIQDEQCMVFNWNELSGRYSCFKDAGINAL
jgi:putative PIN family toxin of toxin-antitoxin system